jgi:hypothetical protein
MEVGGGWALGKMVGKEDGGEVLDISGKVIGVGDLCVLYFSVSLHSSSYVLTSSFSLVSPCAMILNHREKGIKKL